MDNKRIGLFIASVRKEKNMTQKELADKLYISDKAVSKWERGLSMPDIGIIDKLSEILEVSVSEILKGERIDKMTKNKSDEIVKTSVSFFQKEYFKNKIIFILSIAVISIVALGTILYVIGSIDYIRVMNNKKPIFTYHTVDVFNLDVNKKGTDYYGIGYKVSLCNDNNSNYMFQLGHKEKQLCYSSLTCSDSEFGTLEVTDDGKVVNVNNDKTSYKFYFYEDKLYQIDTTQLISINRIENEETWSKEILKYFNVPGISTTINKVLETTYELKQTCNISELLKYGYENVCSINYFGENVFGLTKDDILRQYHKDACK